MARRLLLHRRNREIGAMQRQPQATPELARLGRLIADVPVAMLTTCEPDGSLRSRPLITLQMDSDGALWFLTSISSSKITALDHHGRVNLSYERPDRRWFVSISGVTQVIRDEAKARELWSAALLPWLPRGADDPEVVLLKVLIEEAEYWPGPVGAARRLFGLAGPAENQKILASE